MLFRSEKKSNEIVHSLNDTEFYKKQKRIALRNCGVINPENIDEYIAFDGYQALATCLTERTPVSYTHLDVYKRQVYY